MEVVDFGLLKENVQRDVVIIGLDYHAKDPRFKQHNLYRRLSMTKNSPGILSKVILSLGHLEPSKKRLGSLHLGGWNSIKKD